MNMEPRFFITRRRGMLALWVDVPGFGERNIWDLPAREATPEVLRALQSAFARGVEVATNDVCDVWYEDEPSGWERRS